jgi:Replication-relaxation
MTSDRPAGSKAAAGSAARIAIGAADHAILAAVARFEYMTAAQVCRRLYSGGSLTYARARLSRLAQAGYLHCSNMPKASPVGSTPRVYTLGPKGRTYLAGHGAMARDRLRLSEITEASAGYLQHALGITDFLIAAELFCRSVPEYRIRRMLIERDLRRANFRVTIPGTAGALGVAPDGWIDFRRRTSDGASVQRCVALEFDNDTEHQPAWRVKVARLVAWSRGPYVDYFGTPSLNIAVVTNGGASRQTDLVHWTEAELQRSGNDAARKLFFVSAISPAGSDPGTLFTEPVWHQPFEKTPVPLLSGMDARIPLSD